MVAVGFKTLWCPLLTFLTLMSPRHRSDAIYSALYDGTGHIEVLRGHEYLSHPFAVTLYGGEVYWTDWRTNTLAKANKWTGHNVTVVQRTNTQPFDLQVYHPSRQPLGEAGGVQVGGQGGGTTGVGTGAWSKPTSPWMGLDQVAGACCSHPRGQPFAPSGDA